MDVVERDGVSLEQPQGRIRGLEPIAIIDIGSNSVRLIVYEGLRRSPTPIFNEKMLAGLGKSVATSGKMDDKAVERALIVLTRFHAIAKQLGSTQIHAFATSAVRDAKNNVEFVRDAEAILGTKVRVLTGKQEAGLAASGVISGFMTPHGIVGDLGGGSLELVKVRGHKVTHPESLRLGVLRLADMSGGSLDVASKIVRKSLKQYDALQSLKNGTFYAVGGSLRALATMHMSQLGYPLHVMHNYKISAREALDFVRMVRRADLSTLPGLDLVSSARRPLLGFAATVVEQVILCGKPDKIVFSALGVREGVLFELLEKQDRRRDPLLEACEELAVLRSRSELHAKELCFWTDKIFALKDLAETKQERRLRHAACLLADIGWRAHADYRSEQSLNIIAHAAFVGINHAERAFLALTVYFRYVGLGDEYLSPRIRELTSSRLMERARMLGATLRVAYLLSAAAPGVIDQIPVKYKNGKIVLRLSGHLAALNGERLFNRLNALGRLLGRSAEIEIG